MSSSSSSKKRNRKEDSNGGQVLLTAAELQRLAAKKSTTAAANTAKTTKSDDIDDEIKRLEAELEQDSSDDSSSDSDSSDNGNNTVILALSTSAAEEIQPLPKHLLPATFKRRKLAIDKQNGIAQQQKEQQEFRQKVQTAVKQRLDRPNPKLPFSCRVCAEQFDNELKLNNHRQYSEYHKIAVQTEKKATYCQTCRKQLTSIVQYKEHVSSKPHRERLERIKQRKR